MIIGKYYFHLMSNTTGVVAESFRELIKIIWRDRTGSYSGDKPFWNLSWKLYIADMTAWATMPIDDERAQEALPF